MALRWKAPGERMGVVDLRKFDDDKIVIHYGGQLTSVDAYTFANSLISFADTIRAVNETVNPGQNIEIRLDAVGPGSFKAVVKQIRKGLGGLLCDAPKNLLWMIIGAFLIDPLFEEGQTVEVKDDRVIIRHGGDEIIITRDAYEQLQNVKQNPQVQRGIRRTFEAVEKDDSIENFGLTPDIGDQTPLFQISRDDFARLASPPEIETNEDKRRTQENRAIVILLKPWVDASRHKWAFEWNGVPISAFVRDEDFLDRVKSNEIRFGHGDALEVLIRYHQDYDEDLDVWANDTSTFEIPEVYAYLPSGGQRKDVK